MWCQRWQRQRPRNGCFFSFPLRKKEEMRFDDLCNKCLSRKVSWPLKVLASFLRTKKPPAKSRFGTHPSIGGSLGILRDHQLRNHETHEAIRPGDSTHRGEIRLGGVARICGIDGWKILVKQFSSSRIFFFEMKLYQTLNPSYIGLGKSFFSQFFPNSMWQCRLGPAMNTDLLDMKILVTCDCAHRHAADFCLMMVAICENGSWSFGTTLKTIAPNCIRAVFFWNHDSLLEIWCDL